MSYFSHNSDNTDDESVADNASLSTISLQNNCCLPWPNYSKYFKVLRTIDNNFFYKKLKIQFLICVGTKVLKDDTRSNLNLRKHLNVSTMYISIPTI